MHSSVEDEAWWRRAKRQHARKLLIPSLGPAPVRLIWSKILAASLKCGKRDWAPIFQHCGSSGIGDLSPSSFVALLRYTLRVNETELPNSQVAGIFFLLSSEGKIPIEEFLRFVHDLRRGKKSKEVTWRHWAKARFGHGGAGPKKIEQTPRHEYERQEQVKTLKNMTSVDRMPTVYEKRHIPSQEMDAFRWSNNQAARTVEHLRVVENRTPENELVPPTDAIALLDSPTHIRSEVCQEPFSSTITQHGISDGATLNPNSSDGQGCSTIDDTDGATMPKKKNLSSRSITQPFPDEKSEASHIGACDAELGTASSSLRSQRETSQCLPSVGAETDISCELLKKKEQTAFSVADARTLDDIDADKRHTLASALSEACWRGDASLAAVLMHREHAAAHSPPLAAHKSYVGHAIKTPEFSAVKPVLKPVLLECDWFGSPLHYACIAGSAATVHVLLTGITASSCPTCNASGECSEARGERPNRRVPVVDIGGRNSHGSTPLHKAAAAGSLAVCALLLAHHHGDVDYHCDDEGKSGEAVATTLGQVEINATNWRGETALHNAARGDHGDVVSLLIGHGANPLVRNKAFLTPFGVAKRLGCSNALKALREPTETAKSSGQNALSGWRSSTEPPITRSRVNRSHLPRVAHSSSFALKSSFQQDPSNREAVADLVAFSRTLSLQTKNLDRFLMASFGGRTLLGTTGQVECDGSESEEANGGNRDYQNLSTQDERLRSIPMTSADLESSQDDQNDLPGSKSEPLQQEIEQEGEEPPTREQQQESQIRVHALGHSFEPQQKQQQQWELSPRRPQGPKPPLMSRKARFKVAKSSPAARWGAPVS